MTFRSSISMELPIKQHRSPDKQKDRKRTYETAEQASPHNPAYKRKEKYQNWKHQYREDDYESEE